MNCLINSWFKKELGCNYLHLQFLFILSDINNYDKIKVGKEKTESIQDRGLRYVHQVCYNCK